MGARNYQAQPPQKLSLRYIWRDSQLIDLVNRVMNYAKTFKLGDRVQFPQARAYDTARDMQSSQLV